jgi:hypothetical protein
MFLQILKYFSGIATILTGIVSLFWPMKVLSFTGLDVKGGRGVTEIRSVLGALFVGLGAAVILLNHPKAYQSLGIMYLAMAGVRGISMFVDDSIESSNVISFFVEVIFGVILVL